MSARVAEDFCKRDLSEHAVAYLFIDGIAERLRPGQRREAVLAAWEIGEDGRESLLGLMAAWRMSKRCGRSSRTYAPRAGRSAARHRLGKVWMIRAIEECSARRASAVLASDAQPRSQGLGRSLARFKARVTTCCRRPRARSPDNWRPASAPSTPTSCPVRSPVTRTISRPASRTCASGSRRPSPKDDDLLERLFVEDGRQLKIIPNGFGEKPV